MTTGFDGSSRRQATYSSPCAARRLPPRRRLSEEAPGLPNPPRGLPHPLPDPGAPRRALPRAILLESLVHVDSLPAASAANWEVDIPLLLYSSKADRISEGMTRTCSFSP
jgi:hypothetical protein